MSDQLPKDMDAIRIEYLEAELSAMKQRAEAAEVDLCRVSAERSDYHARMVSAEARIKASQEQEPSIHIGYIGYEVIVRNTPEKMAAAGCVKYSDYYAAPVIPPDVADLQRENAELTRKLAEQQAFTYSLQDLAIWMTGCGYDFSQHTFFTANRERLLSGKPDSSELKNVVESKLTKLLSESKNKAVPEELFDGMGVMNDMQECGTLDVTMESAKFVSDVLDSVVRIIRKRHAAPQPETDLDQAQRLR